MEPADSLPYTKEPIMGPYRQPDESNPQNLAYVFNSFRPRHQEHGFSSSPLLSFSFFLSPFRRIFFLFNLLTFPLLRLHILFFLSPPLFILFLLVLSFISSFFSSFLLFYVFNILTRKIVCLGF
jgi:hypothetical protein